MSTIPNSPHNDRGLTKNLGLTSHTKTQAKDKTNYRKPALKPVTKHIGNKTVKLGNYKYRRKQIRRKNEKGFININIASLNCRSI